MIVKDEAGNVLKGVYRTSTGALAVSDTEQFTKYQREKTTMLEIRKLRQEVDQLKQVVAVLLQKSHK